MQTASAKAQKKAKMSADHLEIGSILVEHDLLRTAEERMGRVDRSQDVKSLH